jgi:hypothetical protein
MTIIPQCLTCKHLREAESAGPKMVCDAFPGGIPMAILLGDHDHTKPYPGDRGIRYEREPKPGKGG